MPANNKQPARPAQPMTRKEIEEIATAAAYREVQRLLGDEQPTGSQSGSNMERLALPDEFAPEIPPVVAPVRTQPTPRTRRFTATLPAKDNGLPERIHGVRDEETKHVILDDGLGVHFKQVPLTWVGFLNGLHEQGQPATNIEWE